MPAAPSASVAGLRLAALGLAALALVAAVGWWRLGIAGRDGAGQVPLAEARAALAGMAGIAALALAAGAAGAVAATRALERRLAAAEAERAAASERENGERRLAALGALAAGMAHELGQPLSAARVSVEGLHYLRQLGREPSPEQVARSLDRVGLSLLAMTQIIEHLRFLAGERPARPPIIDLGAAVAALLADRASWLRWSEAEIAFSPPVVPVMGAAEPAGLGLVLSNLLRNAVEAVAPLPAARRKVEVRIVPGPAIEVSDTGPGIPAEVLARLFEPFASSKGPSRGVGLSLARAAAERMGAGLTCASDHQGTCFTLRLGEAS